MPEYKPGFFDAIWTAFKGRPAVVRSSEVARPVPRQIPRHDELFPSNIDRSARSTPHKIYEVVQTFQPDSLDKAKLGEVRRKIIGEIYRNAKIIVGGQFRRNALSSVAAEGEQDIIRMDGEKFVVIENGEVKQLRFDFPGSDPFVASDPMYPGELRVELDIKPAPDGVTKECLVRYVSEPADFRFSPSDPRRSYRSIYLQMPDDWAVAIEQYAKKDRGFMHALLEDILRTKLRLDLDDPAVRTYNLPKDSSSR